MILFFILMLIPRPIAGEYSQVFIIWDVGQGAASTLVNTNDCVHIDMGGEKFPVDLAKLCRDKKNSLFITHYDWDHINLIKKAKKTLPNFCLMELPTAPMSPRKRRLLEDFLVCKTSPIGVMQVSHSKFNFDNESNSYLIEKKILVTGDAPQKQERYILKDLNFRNKRIQVLVLGHHGSRTSTGGLLLERLPGLRLAVASARKKKYGHPHTDVMARLKRAAVPWLSTEGFGNIFIELHH